MTLVQLSNIFNRVTQELGDFKLYHFGYVTDINTTIENNFVDLECQDKYPAIMFEPPSSSYAIKNNYQTRTVNLWFLDRQQDTVQDGTTCQTLLEKMSNLEFLALNFLKTLASTKVMDDGALRFSVDTTANLNLDAYTLNDRLVACSVTVDIASKPAIDCDKIRLASIKDTDEELLQDVSPV